MKQGTKQTKYKHRSLVQSGVDDRRAFIYLRDCIICRAIEQCKKVMLHGLRVPSSTLEYPRE